MMCDMTRRYVQRARAEAAQQTRRQILDAARATLLEATRLDFSVGDVATAAGVARSTVYSVFGTRAGLLGALADDALGRAGIGEVIAAYQRPDAVEALEGSIRANCRMCRRPPLRPPRREVEPLARSQGDRSMAMGELSRRLADQGRLRADMDTAQAARVLSVLTTFWTFDDLHVAGGLDAAATADVLVGIARATAGQEPSGGSADRTAWIRHAPMR
jgi:AcrR family transcriptional regulator